MATIELDHARAHYLKDVMRLKADDTVQLFNGQDGEWMAAVVELGRKTGRLTLTHQTRTQTQPVGAHLIFAPVKKAGTHFFAEKATELGATRLSPMMTEFTDTGRVNTERLRANAIEAAEQCGRIDIPVIDEPQAFQELLDDWDPAMPILAGDETGGGEPIMDVLVQVTTPSRAAPAFVIGPQGGFSESELARLHRLPFVTRVDLGPRTLRAETTALAVLTCWQAVCGDWRSRTGD